MICHCLPEPTLETLCNCLVSKNYSALTKFSLDATTPNTGTRASPTMLSICLGYMVGYFGMKSGSEHKGLAFPCTDSTNEENCITGISELSGGNFENKSRRFNKQTKKSNEEVHHANTSNPKGFVYIFKTYSTCQDAQLIDLQTHFIFSHCVNHQKVIYGTLRFAVIIIHYDELFLG